MRNNDQREGMAQLTSVYVTFIRATQEELRSALMDAECMKQYWFGVRCESRWTHRSSLKLTYPDGTVIETGEIHEAVPPRPSVIRWQPQRRPEFIVEGDSRLIREEVQLGGTPESNVAAKSNCAVPVLGADVCARFQQYGKCLGL